MTQHRRMWTNRRATALAASLLLNLFFLALIGGYLLHLAHDADRNRLPMGRALAKLEARLPQRDAAAFEGSLRREAPRYASQAQTLRTARRAFDREIRSETFDAGRAAQALAAWRVAWGDYMDAFQGPLIEALSNISPEGRRRLAEAPRGARAGGPKATAEGAPRD